MGVLDGKTVLITGAGGGIGAHLVDAARAAGGRVIACDRSEAALEPIAAEVKITFDLTDDTGCRRAIEQIQSGVGTPDILISNAGFTRAETFDRLDDRAWEHEIDVNLMAARRITTPLLAAMRERGDGSLVFVASVNALAHFGNPAYSVAKAGLLAYMRAIATEYGRFGIRANAVCPGSVRTAAWDHRLEKDPGIVARASRLYPLGRLVTPREVADAALFLASPLASGITGVALPVDAGLTAGNLPFLDLIG